MNAVLRIANLILFPLTIIIGLVLTAAGLNMYLHPKFSSWIPLLGLLFPYLFLVNTVLLVYWWVQLKLKLIIPLCFGIINLPHASKYVQYTAKNKQQKDDFVIATFNTQLFGGTRDSTSFVSFINKLKADSIDILCLQEVFAIDDLKKRVQQIKKAGNFVTYNFVRLMPDRPYGMVVFSKYSILANGRINLGDAGGNMAIWTDIHVDQDTIRMYNLHLQSIRFNRSDYAFIDKPENTGKGALEGSKHIVQRMRSAYVKRANQADSVAKHMESSPHRIFAVGDFNDVPLSYAYQKIGKGMLDAFRERGTGFEQTYKGPFPEFRIDYILFTKQYVCTSYNSYTDVPGDHKLLRASFHRSTVVQ